VKPLCYALAHLWRASKLREIVQILFDHGAQAWNPVQTCMHAITHCVDALSLCQRSAQRRVHHGCAIKATFSARFLGHRKINSFYFWISGSDSPTYFSASNTKTYKGVVWATWMALI
jgi:hypothetical protein